MRKTAPDNHTPTFFPTDKAAGSGYRKNSRTINRVGQEKQKKDPMHLQGALDRKDVPQVNKSSYLGFFFLSCKLKAAPALFSFTDRTLIEPPRVPRTGLELLKILKFYPPSLLIMHRACVLLTWATGLFVMVVRIKGDSRRIHGAILIGDVMGWFWLFFWEIVTHRWSVLPTTWFSGGVFFGYAPRKGQRDDLI